MTSMRPLSLLAVLALALLAQPSAALAESWCAYPLWVHEWGVQRFGRAGAAAATPMPSYFHQSTGTPGSAGAPTRDMAPDSGIRELPILHFYSSGTLSRGDEIPVGVEVGFTEGDALAWYPQVDARIPATQANGAAAQAARRRLLRTRGQPMGGQLPSVVADPTRQLVWNHLTLTRAPAHPRAGASEPWVDALRGFPALWVNGARESERFVFYEARTEERTTLRLERGTWRRGHREVVVRNAGPHDVHDVFLVHRERGSRFVFHAPRIPGGARVSFVLERSRARTDALFLQKTRTRLRDALVDADQPEVPTGYSWAGGCTMMRDPAVPVETSEGHRLYRHEVDAILDVWGARFFDQPGTTVVYREDPSYLDAVMPLSIYTDMYNFVLLRRTGLAVWSAELP